MLRNEPYTKVLQRFFPHAKVPDGVFDIFEKVDLTYKVSGEVINVMIHFIHAERRSWSKTSIEQLASDLLGKHISRYEQAVDYVREKRKQKLEISQRIAGSSNASSIGRANGGRGSVGGSNGKASRGTSQKPKLPVASSRSNLEPPTPEELDHIRKIVIVLKRRVEDGVLVRGYEVNGNRQA
jgi:replication initiation and membrane attachment protein